MSCFTCRRPAQFREDSSNPRIFCGKKCQLIAAGEKRDRAENDYPCKNTTDPFNLDEFGGMEPRQVIVVGEHCFHLPSLYDWIHNRNNSTNPLTNSNFSPEDIVLIRETALERYPLQVNVISITGNGGKYETTSLISVSQLIMLIVGGDTIREALNRFVGINLIQRGGGKGSLVNLLVDGRESVQIIDINGDATTLDLYRKGMLTPPEGVYLYTKIRNFLQSKGFPVNEWNDRIRELHQVIDRNEESSRFTERVREMRRANEPAQRNRPPNTIQINVQVNSEFGWAYGSFPVFLPLEQTRLADIEPETRAELAPYVDLPPDQMDFIYAGRLYNGETRLTDLPRFGEGSLIHTTFSRRFH